MSDFTEIVTQRFKLMQILPEDQSFIFNGLSHPLVISHYGVSYATLAETAAQMIFYERVWRERTGCYWKIVDNQTGEGAGVCGMSSYDVRHEKAEVGAWLLPAFWGKGIMTEAMKGMIPHLFQHWKLHRLEAVVETGNVASGKLFKRLGFQFEAVLREAEIKNGNRISLEMYSLLVHEYQFIP